MAGVSPLLTDQPTRSLTSCPLAQNPPWPSSHSLVSESPGRSTDSARMTRSWSSGASGSSNQVTATTTAAATCYTATNFAHVQAGRAHNSVGYALANGSNENMGLNNVAITKTLKMTGANYYVIGTCP